MLRGHWRNGRRDIFLLRLPNGNWRIRIKAVVGWRLRVISDCDFDRFNITDWYQLLWRTR